uniref:Cytochrome P450 n=1 Tax=Caenorhabditis japonica TaxID=281687 RepID=A0A8R1DT90_CAEJA
MALFLPILLAVFLTFIAANWKTFRLIIKFWSYDKQIPGPPAHPIFGNASIFAGKSTVDITNLFIDMANEVRKTGKNVMRYRLMGKMFVWPLNGETLSKLVESTTELNKGDDYQFLEPWLGGGLLLVGYGEKWRSHRKMLTPTFHFAKLEGYLEVFNCESRIFVECLEKYADDEITVDLFPFIKRCLLDIICETAMGIKVDAQYNHNHPYVHAVEGFNRLSVIFAVNPLLQFYPIFWALGYKKQRDDYLHILKKFSKDVIDERKSSLASGEVEKETSKRKMNFLDILLNSAETNALTAEEIREEVDNFMFAGHDTTTTSLSWVCWNLAHNPDVQEKVYEEIISIFGDDPNQDVTTEGISKLEYTERVLKESKRIIAPVPSLQRKLREDMILDGCIIPSESNVSIAPLVLHSNPQVFANPEKFDPDRFLPDEIAKRNPYDYVPFSAGLRNCIGQKFSQLNEKVMLIHLMRNYRMEAMRGFYDTLPSFEIIAKPSNGIPVKLIRR